MLIDFLLFFFIFGSCFYSFKKSLIFFSILFFWLACEFPWVFLSTECYFHNLSGSFVHPFFFYLYVCLTCFSPIRFCFCFYNLSFCFPFFLTLLCFVFSSSLFLICALGHVATLRVQAWTSKLGHLNLGCGATRELLTIQNINQHTLSPKSLSQNKN